MIGGAVSSPGNKIKKMLHKLSSDASGYSNGPKPGPQKPPRTCDEWLKSSSGAGALVSTDGTIFIPSRDRGAIMWPIHPPHLDYLVAADTQSGHHQGTKVARKHDCPGDTILGSLEEIRADLEKNARKTSPHSNIFPQSVSLILRGVILFLQSNFSQCSVSKPTICL